MGAAFLGDRLDPQQQRALWGLLARLVGLGGELPCDRLVAGLLGLHAGLLGLAARLFSLGAGLLGVDAGLLGLATRRQGDRRRRDRDDADHTGHDRQDADDPVVATGALDDLAHLAAALEKVLLDRRQPDAVGRDPGLRLDQSCVAQQETIGAPL